MAGCNGEGGSAQVQKNRFNSLENYTNGCSIRAVDCSIRFKVMTYSKKDNYKPFLQFLDKLAVPLAFSIFHCL